MATDGKLPVILTGNIGGRNERGWLTRRRFLADRQKHSTPRKVEKPKSGHADNQGGPDKARTVARNCPCPAWSATMDMHGLLLLDFGDGFDPTLFRGGKGHLIAGMQFFQRQAVLCLELFGRTTGVGPDGAALRLANGDRVVNPVNFR